MISLATAEQCAAAVIALLRPACAEIATVGSVRRRRQQVKGLEFVVRPKAAQPVFGEKASAVSPLAVLLPQLVRRGELTQCPDPTRRLDGPRQKRLWFPDAKIEVELFLADAENWGNTITIRTGDYEFSRMLVTQRRDGGLLTNGWMHCAGYLWDFRLPEQERASFTRAKAPKPPIACPTETDFWQALGIDEPPPPYGRDLGAAQRLRATLGRARASAR